MSAFEPTGVLIELLWIEYLYLYFHSLKTLDRQVFDELYGILSVDTAFFGLTAEANHTPETNYIPTCMDIRDRSVL
jgi:hypothetical protein